MYTIDSTPKTQVDSSNEMEVAPKKVLDARRYHDLELK